MQLHAHNGIGFDGWIILNILPCDKHIVDIIKNGKGKIVLNGYIQKGKRQIPRYLIFRCGMTLSNYSLKNIGKTFNLQKEFIKTEMNHDEVDGKNYRYEKDEWLDYVQQDVLCIVFLRLGILKLWKNSLVLD